MECGTCKECRWWKPPRIGDQGRCALAASRGGYPAYPKGTSTLMTAMDQSQLEAWLFTAPDFGCVLWESKG